MNESDANRAMTDTARLRLLPNPLEDTQRMPVHARRNRQHEAIAQYARGAGWQWREPFERLVAAEQQVIADYAREP
ncbi:MAG: hypothetical protein WCC64_04585 [Aliidongia sp.]